MNKNRFVSSIHIRQEREKKELRTKWGKKQPRTLKKNSSPHLNHYDDFSASIFHPINSTSIWHTHTHTHTHSRQGTPQTPNITSSTDTIIFTSMLFSLLLLEKVIQIYFKISMEVAVNKIDKICISIYEFNGSRFYFFFIFSVQPMWSFLFNGFVSFIQRENFVLHLWFCVV